MVKTMTEYDWDLYQVLRSYGIYIDVRDRTSVTLVAGYKTWACPNMGFAISQGMCVVNQERALRGYNPIAW